MDNNSFARPLFIGAAACGAVHAGFSLYWATGGEYLIATLCNDTSFLVRPWLLGAIGILKCAAACTPLDFDFLEWPYPAVTKGICCIGGGALIIWGGTNTVVDNFVLLGTIDSGDSLNTVAMIGHDWLWDPLFLLWGAFLPAGLVAGRNQNTITGNRRQKGPR